jgi:hypothetical protein
VTGIAGRFRYALLRNDGSVAAGSPLSYGTEELAHAEGRAALKRCSAEALPDRPGKDPKR